MLGSVVGCTQGVGVMFLVMSGTSQLCMLGSVVGCVQGVGVLLLAMSGISDQCVGQCCGMCSGVWGHVPGHVWHLRTLYVGHLYAVLFMGFRVLFLVISGTSQHCVLGSVVGCV